MFSHLKEKLTKQAFKKCRHQTDEQFCKPQIQEEPKYIMAIEEVDVNESSNEKTIKDPQALRWVLQEVGETVISIIRDSNIEIDQVLDQFGMHNLAYTQSKFGVQMHKFLQKERIYIENEYVINDLKQLIFEIETKQICELEGKIIKIYEQLKVKHPQLALKFIKNCLKQFFYINYRKNSIEKTQFFLWEVRQSLMDMMNLQSMQTNKMPLEIYYSNNKFVQEIKKELRISANQEIQYSFSI